MFNSLKTKITVPIIGILIVLIALIIVYASIDTAYLVNSNVDSNMETSIQTVQAYLASLEHQTHLAADMMGRSADLSLHIWTRDRQALSAYLQERKVFMGMDEVIVTDAQGIVIARSSDPSNFGDDISDLPAVAAGLRGESISMYVPTPDANMVIAATSAIYNHHQLIGAVVVHYVIGSDAFIDNLREVFNVDITVFAGGTSVASTLRHPETGARLFGTEAAADISGPILSGAVDQMVMDLNILGMLPYKACYLPLKGLGGEITGMFFLGIPQQYELDIINAQRRNIILIGAAGVIIAAAIALLIIIRSLKPLERLAKNVNEVSAGNFNVNLRSLSRDEVGKLTVDVANLVDTIKAVNDDVLNFAHQTYDMGDKEFKMNPHKYQGGFRLLVESINGVPRGSDEESILALQVMENIGKGIFDFKVERLRGKRAAVNDAIDVLMNVFKDLSASINDMIDAAAVKGNMHFSIDECKYEGQWQTIIKGLNDIALAVNRPISEIRDVMGNLARGDFSQKVNGHYAGDFAQIKEAVNNTIETLSHYILEITDFLSRVQSGDLTQSITRDYVGSFSEIKDSLNNISETLNKTMSEISMTSEQVLAGASTVSASALELANGTGQQADALQELNASVELINTQTQKNAENADEASNLSTKSTENAKSGNEAMQHMLEAMNQIKESSNAISGIIKVIQDIAFQTNMLALNASVEAARAGEHGRGFAVVAEEVRNLAIRSQQAASDTTSLIADSISRVDTGSGITRSTADALNIIVQNADEVLNIIRSISESAKNEAQAIGQLSQGISQISDVVQNNSAISEEAAATAQELNVQADALQKLVAYFKVQ